MIKTTAHRSLERIATQVYASDHEACAAVGQRIADLIAQRNAECKATVLGLATGHTPIGVYRELIGHHERGLDFSRVITFNLDEYYPMAPGGLQSYRRWMWENLFEHVNVRQDNVHIPDGTIEPERVVQYCADFERKIAEAGGIDVQLLGIGRTGHVGFNEPGSSIVSRTRRIALDPITRRDAASDFFGESSVPREAITMGIGTILEANEVVLLAFGEQKAPIIQRAVEGEVTDSVPATFLHEHPNALVVLDEAAAANLTRIQCPWLVEDLDWTAQRVKQAVVWLSQKTKTSILKLGRDDYDRCGLAPLLRTHESVDALNRMVFRELADTIRGRAGLPRDKNILVFSPHPDDDSISMGGTIHKLVQNANRVHVAYMTSGNIAVFDDDALQTAELVGALNQAFGFAVDHSASFVEETRCSLAEKKTGEPDAPPVQRIKSLMRRSEARAACRQMGVDQKHVHFLDMPFYQTGLVRKLPISSEDVRICHDLIKQIRPQWVFFAGEMSDPHGTHRLCADAVMRALSDFRPDTKPEAVWMYRGAWQEWEPEVVDLVVPLSRDELTHKIFGIFKHESQKDKALFPGPYDDREFWQRAEARNRRFADLFDQLGLPEYFAMEAFVRWTGG